MVRLTNWRRKLVRIWHGCLTKWGIRMPVYRNWRRCTLGDVITLQRGFDLPERERRPGDVPIVSSSGLTGYHNVAKVKGPGVITGRYGTLGEIFYAKDDF